MRKKRKIPIPRVYTSMQDATEAMIDFWPEKFKGASAILPKFLGWIVVYADSSGNAHCLIGSGKTEPYPEFKFSSDKT